jgi:hypothetical protein
MRFHEREINIQKTFGNKSRELFDSIRLKEERMNEEKWKNDSFFI